MKKVIFVLMALITLTIVSCSNSTNNTDEPNNPPTTEIPGENNNDLPNNGSNGDTGSNKDNSSTEDNSSNGDNDSNGDNGSSEDNSANGDNDSIENNDPNDNEKDLELLIEEVYSGSYYGNSNGNLNNKGLAVYSYANKLHYYSLQNSIYSFNPLNNETELIYEFEKGRPIYLNVTAKNLYFINSYSGYIFNYDLTTKTIETVNENENLYLYVNDFIFTLQPIETNEVSNINYLCYRLNNYDLLHRGFSKIEFISISSNIVYYMVTDELTLKLMNYNGKGRTNISYLDESEVEEIFELIMYKENDHEKHYMMIANINNTTGLYLYDTTNKEFKLVLTGSMHSLNYHKNSIFIIKENSLYEIPFDTLGPVLLIDELEDKVNLQVINNWLYVGSVSSSSLYQFHPITKTLKKLD